MQTNDHTRDLTMPAAGLWSAWMTHMYSFGCCASSLTLFALPASCLIRWRRCVRSTRRGSKAWCRRSSGRSWRTPSPLWKPRWGLSVGQIHIKQRQGRAGRLTFCLSVWFSFFLLTCGKKLSGGWWFCFQPAISKTLYDPSLTFPSFTQTLSINMQKSFSVGSERNYTKTAAASPATSSQEFLSSSDIKKKTILLKCFAPSEPAWERCCQHQFNNSGILWKYRKIYIWRRSA